MSFWAICERARRVDEERLQVCDLTGVRKFDVGIEKPVQEITVFELLDTVHVKMSFKLGPDLVLDLLSRAVHGGFAVKNTGGIPIRNIYRKNAPQSTVSVVFERIGPPELPLGNRRQRPWRVDVDRMAMNHRNIALEIELNSTHPGGLQLIDVG